MNRIIKAFKDPYWALSVVLRRFSPLIKDDRSFIKMEYYLGMHKRLNLDNPRTYNEKLQWLKLHARREDYTHLVDKYEVKSYVAQILGQRLFNTNIRSLGTI